jgi:hypothetical protein
MADEKTPTVAELALKYGGKPCQGLKKGCEIPTFEEMPGCWRFLHNRDCRAWAKEARDLGYDVHDSLDIGGLMPGESGIR